MGKKDDAKAANKKLSEEKRKLEDLNERQKKNGIKHENPEWKRQHDRVIEAEKNATKLGRFLRS